MSGIITGAVDNVIHGVFASKDSKNLKKDFEHQQFVRDDQLSMERELHDIQVKKETIELRMKEIELQRMTQGPKDKEESTAKLKMLAVKLQTLNVEKHTDKDALLMEAVDKSDVKEVTRLVKTIEDDDTLSLAQEIAKEKGNITIIKVIDRALKKRQEKEEQQSITAMEVQGAALVVKDVPELLPDLKPFEFKTIHSKGFLDPIARSGHRIVYYNHSIYSLGGFNPNISTNDYSDKKWEKTHPMFLELWQFNLISRSWHMCKDIDNGMPENMISHCLTIRGDSLLVYGGSGKSFGYSSSNAFHSYHLPSGCWQKIHTKGQLPDPMYGQAICLSGDSLYVVGGTSGLDFSIDVHCLDLKTMIWEHLTPSLKSNNYLPEGRYRHEIVYHKGALYVFGGGQIDATYDLSTIPTFIINEKKWTKTKTKPDRRTLTSPPNRRCHVTCKLGGYVYIHGGFNGAEAYDDIWRLNINTFEWQKLRCKTESPLYFHSAAFAECGKLIIFGGVKNINPQVRTSEVSAIWLPDE